MNVEGNYVPLMTAPARNDRAMHKSVMRGLSYRIRRDGCISGHVVTERRQSDEPGMHVLMRLLRTEDAWWTDANGIKHYKSSKHHRSDLWGQT